MFLEKFTKWNLLHPGCMYVTWTSTEILNWGRWKVYKWWKTLVPSVSHKPSEVNLCITHHLLGTMLVICSFGEWPKKSHLFVVVLTPIILIKKKVWIWGQPSTCIQGWRGSTTPLTLWWKQYLKKKKRSRSESATICLWWPGLHLKIGGGALTKLTWQSCVPLLATAG